MPVRFRTVWTHEDVCGARVERRGSFETALSSGQTGMAWDQARLSEEEEKGCQRNGLLVIASAWWRNLPEHSSTETLARLVLKKERLPLGGVEGGWAYTVTPKLLLAPLLKGWTLWWWSSKVAGTARPGGVHGRFMRWTRPPWALSMLCWYMPPGSLRREKQMTNPPLMKLWVKNAYGRNRWEKPGTDSFYSRRWGIWATKQDFQKLNKTFAKSWWASLFYHQRSQDKT